MNSKTKGVIEFEIIIYDKNGNVKYQEVTKNDINRDNNK